MTDWTGRTATEIAAAVRAGEATAGQVVACHLDRIAKLNGELGAFIRVRAAEAASEAEAVGMRADLAELPLAGVPVAVKDAVPVAGEPMRTGSAALPDAPQGEDHPLVARLRAAGAVVIGLTNLPELAIYPFTDSAFGITRNPWDRRRTAGGSSGGSAAAVAAALVPVAHGTDGLGSVRIPAAACGLFGIKPGSVTVLGFPGPYAGAMEPRTRRHVLAGRAVQRVRPPAGKDRDRLRAALAPFFDRHDVLVMPALARPCPAAKRYGERSWLRSVATSLMFAPMTGVWNLAGFPAASVPAAAVRVVDSGLPARADLIVCQQRHDPRHLVAPRVPEDHHVTSPWRVA